MFISIYQLVLGKYSAWQFFLRFNIALPKKSFKMFALKGVTGLALGQIV